MSINVGELTHPKGQIRLEISNDDLFIKRIKEINRELPGTQKENMKRWKIRRVGEDRVPAKIQALIDNNEVETTSTGRELTDADFEKLADEAEKEPSKEDMDKLGEAIKDLEAVQQEHGIAVPPIPPNPRPARLARRARPGGKASS